MDAVKGDETQQPSERRVRKAIRTLLKGWRALLFLLLALIFGLLAFNYKALSDPGSESKQLAEHAPQEIDFFASSPGTSIDVGAYIGPTRTTSPQPIAENYISVTVNAPPNIKSVDILILTNSSYVTPVPTQVSPPFRLSALPPLENIPPAIASPEQHIINGFSAETYSVGTGQQVNVAGFTLGEDLEQTNAYLYGHLPAIGTVDQDLSYSPAIFGYVYSKVFPSVLAESYKNVGNWYPLRDALLEPGTQGSEAAFSNPKSYRTPFGGPGELFYTPSKISITETQSNLASAIETRQVTRITPGGQVNGLDYTWQGSGYLEPIFQAANSDALQSEGNYAFLSGIFFGVAGAASIAFIQEIPETFSQPVWWSRRKRKRRSSSQNATDEKPDSAEAEGQEAGTKRTSKTAPSSTGLGWPSSD